MFNIRENYIEKRFRKKAKKMNISIELLYGKNGNQGINIIKMINRSCDADDFIKVSRWEVIKKRYTDYYHHSLIMGQYFGYYNVFPYLFISQKIRNEIGIIRPNKEKTKCFLKIIIKKYIYILIINII